jgi:DNA polymerase sigma
MSLAELLLGFLDYYAHRFNFEELAISIRLGRAVPIDDCKFVESADNDPYQWNLLCIEGTFKGSLGCSSTDFVSNRF